MSRTLDLPFSQFIAPDIQYAGDVDIHAPAYSRKRGFTFNLEAPNVHHEEVGAIVHARLLAVHGVWQRSEESHSAPVFGAVRNLVARHLEDLSPLLGRFGTSSLDFH